MDKDKLRSNLRKYEIGFAIIGLVVFWFWFFGPKKPTTILLLLLLSICLGLRIAQMVLWIQKEIRVSKTMCSQNDAEGADLMGKKKLSRILGFFAQFFWLLLYVDIFLSFTPVGRIMPIRPLYLLVASRIARSFVDWRIEEAEEAQKK